MKSSILPKRELISILTAKIPEADLRAIFSIQPQTNLASRLDDLPKQRLVEVISTMDVAKTELLSREQNYPLRSSPSAYLLVLSNTADWKGLQKLVDASAAAGRTAGLIQSGHQIQAVYSSTASRVVLGPPPLLEIMINYEIEVQYRETNPDSDHYGELLSTYSLERALIWLPQRPLSHALMICSDFSALGPIRRFLGSKLGIQCDVPNLTQEMLLLISQGGAPRTATFGTQYGARSETFDASTVMVADPNLADKSTFKTLRGDRSRQQTSGFFSNHPGVLIGGLGISRRYGKIWTPTHLGLDALRKLAGDIVSRVENQLSQTLEQSTRDYMSYFHNMEYKLGEAVLQGRVKNSFEALLATILAAQRTSTLEARMSTAELLGLIEHGPRLKLQGTYEFECSSCHVTRLARCKYCAQQISTHIEKGLLLGRCGCGTVAPITFDCDCGEESPILDLTNHVFLYPEPDLIQSIANAAMKVRQAFRGLFFIRSGNLGIITESLVKGLSNVDLQDFDLWRRRAKLHLRSVAKTSKTLNDILNLTKEKCYIGGVGPDKARCQSCLASKPALNTLESGQLCLLRLFGLPIGKGFDGIHTGAEMADIKYEDELPNLGPVRVGIHVKSYNGQYKRLGRGSLEGKGLYAQLAYSIYKVHKGEYPFDVLGVSIPQDLNPTVLESLRYMAQRAGIPLIVMQRQDWLKLAEAAHEELVFDQALSAPAAPVNQG